jgi:hypothetical protein
MECSSALHLELLRPGCQKQAPIPLARLRAPYIHARSIVFVLNRRSMASVRIERFKRAGP